MDIYLFIMYNCLIMDNYRSGINIKIIVGEHSRLYSDWGFRNDNEPYARLYYIKSGDGYLIGKDGERTELIPGMLYLIPPHSGMSSGCRERIEIIWIHFSFEVFSSVSIFNIVEFECGIRPEGRKFTENAMGTLVRLYKGLDFKTVLHTSGLLFQILSWFAKERLILNSRSKLIDDRFVPVLEYIDKNIRRKISISALARMAALERAYFSSLFSRTFGISLKQYILRRKIERARALLLNSEMKVYSIAREFGFIDAFHFSKTFKKITGRSPAEFMKNKDQIIP